MQLFSRVWGFFLHPLMLSGEKSEASVQQVEFTHKKLEYKM